MKGKIILLVLLSIAIVTCKDKEMTEPKNIYYGTGSANLSGYFWAGKTRTKFFNTCNNGSMNIIIDEYNNEIQKSELVIQAVPLSKGDFYLKLYKNVPCDSLATSFNTRISDGDVAGNFYKLLTSDSIQDWLNITTFNDESLEFNGEFQASFYRDTSLPKFDFSLPDTLVFTNGIFNGKLME